MGFFSRLPYLHTTKSAREKSIIFVPWSGDLKFDGLIPPMLRPYIAPGSSGRFLAKFGLFWAILGYFRSEIAHGTQLRYIDAASVVRDHRFLNPKTTPGSKNDILFPRRLHGVKI